MKSILILADVPNWAWAKKARQLKQHLTEFYIDISYTTAGFVPQHDLIHTFEVNQMDYIGPGRHKVTTGITAHVWNTWEQKLGQGTVAKWAGRAHAVHANSRLLQTEIAAHLGRSVHYVPNGVDEIFYKRLRPRSSSNLVVGFVGKPNPRKGYSIVAEACRLAGVELREVQRRSQDALDENGMREFYQDIHVHAVASEMDGTPNPALEAAACGCAVVSNKIGNMPELIRHGENGMMVERNAESLAAAFRELAGDLPRAIKMGEAARATIEADWTWAKLSRNYANMWNSVLG